MTLGTVEVVWLETQGGILEVTQNPVKGRNPYFLVCFNAFSRVLSFHTQR